MYDDPDSARLEHIRSKMLTLTDEELETIITEKDTAQWTPEAAEIAEEIYQERTGTLPNAIYVVGSEAEGSDVTVRADTFYDFDRVERIANWAGWLSWFFLALPIFVFAFNIYVTWDPREPRFLLTGIVYAFASTGLTLIIGGLAFILLQAISESIYVLLDIEANTRQ